MKIERALEAAGTALLLLPTFLLLISPSKMALYHHSLPMTHLVGGYLVDLAAVAVAVFAFLALVDRLAPGPRRLLRALFAAFLLWRMVDVALFVYENMVGSYPKYQLGAWGQARRPVCLAALLAAAALAALLPRAARLFTRAMLLLAGAYGMVAVWAIPELVHVAAIRSRGETATAAPLSSPPAPGPAAPGRRIVWILFDELSYAQAFEERAAGVDLPAFEQLRQRSVAFGNVRPAGFYTDRIIPALFLGRRIDEIRGGSDGNLWYRQGLENRWHGFDPGLTLFASAQRKGWNPGIDGWYNPYCRILGTVLSACFWRPVALFPMEQYGASEEKSILANAAVLPRQIFRGVAGSGRGEAEQHLEDYRSTMARARVLLEDSRLHFVFLHLPVPHPPGIYDRARGQLRSGGSYFDNLVLADQALRALLEEIGRTPAADRTTLVVSSDHSWRTPMWRSSRGWMPEEERVSGERFDDRPVLLVHFPGQQQGEDVRSPLPELLEHDMIEGMLAGSISDRQTLNLFLVQHGGTVPAG